MDTSFALYLILDSELAAERLLDTFLADCPPPDQRGTAKASVYSFDFGGDKKWDIQVAWDSEDEVGREFGLAIENAAHRLCLYRLIS